MSYFRHFRLELLPFRRAVNGITVLLRRVSCKLQNLTCPGGAPFNKRMGLYFVETLSRGEWAEGLIETAARAMFILAIAEKQNIGAPLNLSPRFCTWEKGGRLLLRVDSKKCQISIRCRSILSSILISIADHLFCKIMAPQTG